MKSRSAQVRSHLDHPVIDSDGHLFEFYPMFLDYLKGEAGSGAADRMVKAFSNGVSGSLWFRLTPQERRERRITRPGFWSVPTRRTEDLATTILPRLLYERMEEMGLDFTVLYPSMGIGAIHFGDQELRRASCRALNRMFADLYRDYADAITPAGLIPMHTPAEAIDELQYAVRELGFKVVLLPGYVRRSIPEVERKYPHATRYAFWLDTYGVESEHDYDPVWAKCQELRVAGTFHSLGAGWGSFTSTTSFMYNHIGHFAAAGDAICKSLFLGGVTRRFPVNFAFLEGGVGWARSLLAGIIGHWSKRNVRALENYDPRNLDLNKFRDLMLRYGDEFAKKCASGEVTLSDVVHKFLPAAFKAFDTEMPSEDLHMLDEWAACGIETVEDIGKLFSPFYFGCEADDPVTASAFDAKHNPLGVRLNAIFGSDIGHWDVPDMTEVLEEAYEPVEEGKMTPDDFRDFVFANPLRLWTGGNPDFFKGTRVETAVNRFLGSRR
jgi:predicted TIM-barrel fold metal-dependent hydrolase